ncbi:MAG TPA: LysR substrate-binding domain-containing protein [Geminicoccaceae bacterium]|nr:LysR substrate-binding domain-containing protein [Geminicoccus sp.]HMU52347.1 LysR substrate-binding domain-containing protein [Geminicoccaceae bacterium]
MEFTLDLQLLRAVMAIARTGSISAAAEELALSQSAVTKQLQRIEDRLGVRLFERRARGVEPTVYGEALVRRGQLIDRQLGDTLDELRALAGGERGDVAIGAGQTWLHGPLPRALTRLVKRRPGVRVRVIAEPMPRMLDELRASRLDLVFAPWTEEIDRSAIAWTPILVDDLQVMARRGHPLVRTPPASLRDLDPFGWALSGPANPTRRRLAAIYEHEGLHMPGPVIEAESLTLLTGLVRGSDLLTVLPNVRFPWMKRGLAVIDSPRMAWRRASGIFRRQDAVPTPAARALLDELLRVCRSFYGEAGLAVEATADLLSAVPDIPQEEPVMLAEVAR